MLDKPAAEHDRVRVQKIDDLREPARQAVGVALERRPRPLVAARGPRRDGGRVAGARAVAVARETGAGDHRLEAAVPPAPAARPRQLRREAARAAGCGPTPRRSGAVPRAPCPWTTMPPPQPVPRITPNTTSLPAPAPSAASLSAKQWASFWTRTSRPSSAAMSRSSACPFRTFEFAFFTRPVAGLIAPGMPTPTVAVTPSSASVWRTSPAIAPSLAA